MTFLVGIALVAMPIQKPAPFSFSGASYVHRYSKGDLHEFTPKAQGDLNKWADMITLNVYPAVKNGEDLASTANAVLENYKAAKGIVTKTTSLPRTATRPAEHLIVVLFPRPDFIEASFARFRMANGTGVSLVYAHRIYGKKAGNTMSSWFKQNGPRIEKALMSLKTVPTVPK